MEHCRPYSDKEPFLLEHALRSTLLNNLTTVFCQQYCERVYFFNTHKRWANPIVVVTHDSTAKVGQNHTYSPSIHTQSARLYGRELHAPTARPAAGLQVQVQAQTALNTHSYMFTVTSPTELGQSAARPPASSSNKLCSYTFTTTQSKNSRISTSCRHTLQTIPEL